MDKRSPKLSGYIDPCIKSYFDPIPYFIKNKSKNKNKQEKYWLHWNSYEIAMEEATDFQKNNWNSFREFRMSIANHRTYPHMEKWEKLLFTNKNSRYLYRIAGKDTLILAPRESAKSTYLAQFIAYIYGLHLAPWHKIALKILGLSYNLESALPRSRQIQAIIQSDIYQEIFPWIRPSKKKWGEKEWMLDLQWAELPEIEEQYSYVAGGLAGGINSRRCHVIFLDDLIKSPESIKNQSIREAMVNTWRSIIQFCRYDGSRAICLGTQMSAQDIYCTEFTEEKNWEILRQSALIDEDGIERSFWEPENDHAPGIPLKRLLKEREEMPIEFAFQRQNKILKIQEQSIPAELIQRKIIPDKFDYLIMGCDLSAGLKEKNDYSAFVLGGKINKEFWIIDAWEGRILGNLEKAKIILDLWDLWKNLLPKYQIYNFSKNDYEEIPEIGLILYFDSSAYGLSFKGDFEDFLYEKNISDWRIIPISASGRGDKLYRLRRHSGLFYNKKIFFNKFSRILENNRKPLDRLIDQLIDFGNTPHDDLADAFELCISGLRSNLPLSFGNLEY